MPSLQLNPMSLSAQKQSFIVDGSSQSSTRDNNNSSSPKENSTLTVQTPSKSATSSNPYKVKVNIDANLYISKRKTDQSAEK